jgi:hypothetical protein
VVMIQLHRRVLSFERGARGFGSRARRARVGAPARRAGTHAPPPACATSRPRVRNVTLSLPSRCGAWHRKPRKMRGSGHRVTDSSHVGQVVALAGGTSRFPQTPSTGPLRGQAASPPAPYGGRCAAKGAST